jgi:predicted DNA-binding transcriptional regulator AlpA
MKIFKQNCLIKVNEVAEVLSMRPSTIMNYVYKGIIPCFKLGGSKKGAVRFSPQQLNEWLIDQEVHPPEKFLENHFPKKVKVKKLKKGAKQEFERFIKRITDSKK